MFWKGVVSHNFLQLFALKKNTLINAIISTVCSCSAYLRKVNLHQFWEWTLIIFRVLMYANWKNFVSKKTRLKFLKRVMKWKIAFFESSKAVQLVYVNLAPNSKNSILSLMCLDSYDNQVDNGTDRLGDESVEVVQHARGNNHISLISFSASTSKATSNISVTMCDSFQFVFYYFFCSEDISLPRVDLDQENALPMVIGNFY